MKENRPLSCPPGFKILNIKVSRKKMDLPVLQFPSISENQSRDLNMFEIIEENIFIQLEFTNIQSIYCAIAK